MSAARGLTGAEAAARLARDGPNVLPSGPARPAWRELAGQMTHFFARVLWVAAGLAVASGQPQLGLAIVAVIVVNGLFAFAQERRAERAAARLRALLPERVTVVRDGVPRTVPAETVVVGDLVRLRAGDRVPADATAVSVHGARLDTSLLTGESVPVDVAVGGPLPAGTYVVDGEVAAVVDATGAATRVAGIARLAEGARRPPSPLARELARVVRTVALVALGVGVVFFALATALGTAASEGFVLALGVTVALVPEGLLPTVTLSLAMGAQRMAHRHALVRRLEAVETLGAVTVVCTDKTGTLTRNELSVVEVWTPVGTLAVAPRGYDPTPGIDGPPSVVAAARDAVEVARACSDGRLVRHDDRWVPHGDPMEVAIDVLARALGLPAGDVGRDAEQARYPFDPRRRLMTVVAGGRVATKGAPEAVLARCRDPDGAPAAVEAMAARGLRVIAVASRPPPAGGASRREEVERDLHLVALLGFEDPPRPQVRAAMDACRRAGIKVVMVTGDHPATAGVVAREVGLTTDGGPVVEGRDLPEDDEALGVLLDRDGAVVARVEPETKLRIARALRARGHVVAMTGDGVNDAPALGEADVGVAMGRSGTDVARAAADVVLLDDDFSTIVAAVEQGRATFSNIRRFLTYHLTDNVAEVTPFLVWALSAGRVPLALGVLQILCLDIGTDLLPALALGAEPPAPHVLDQPPSRRHLIDRALLARVFGVLGPAEAVGAMLAFVASFAASGWRPGAAFPGGGALAVASGAAFAAVVLGQAANAFACRSATRPVWVLRWRQNRLVPWAVAVELAALGGFLFLPPVAGLLGHAPPSAAGWAAALAAPALVLAADTLAKRYGRGPAGPRRG